MIGELAIRVPGRESPNQKQAPEKKQLKVEPTWVSWSDDTICVYRLTSGAELAIQTISRRMHPSHRYFLRLFRMRDNKLRMRSSDGAQTRLDQEDPNGALRPVEDFPPELARLPPYQVLPLSDGTVVGWDDQASSFVLWRENNPTAVRPLPSGFRARDFNRDSSGLLWAAGSSLSMGPGSDRRHEALLVSRDDGASWEDSTAIVDPPSSWLKVFFTIVPEFSSIKIVNGLLVLARESGDIGEDSTLVFTWGQSRGWQSHLLWLDNLRAVLDAGDGDTAIVSHRGRVVLCGNTDRSFNLHDRISSLLRAANDALPSRLRCEILDLAISDDRVWFVLVSVRSSSPGLARLGEAVVRLGDGGDDQLLHFQPDTEPEVVALNLSYLP